MMIFFMKVWDGGGPELVDSFAGRGKPCRVLITGDERAIGRSPEYLDDGAQGVLLFPMSTAELDLAVDGLMMGPPALVDLRSSTEIRAAEAAEDTSKESADPAPADQLNPDDPERAAKKVKVRAHMQLLAGQLRAGKARVSNISPVAMELQGLCAADETPSLGALVSKIEQDPNLALAVLKASNTAAYRGMPSVMDLTAAGRRLGSRRMGEVAQMEAIKGAFVAGKGSGWSRLLSRMWRNTVVTAIASRNMAERLGSANRGEVYSMALFHNLGEILVVDIYKSMEESPPRDGYVSGGMLEDMDKQHAALGALLLKSWNMSSSLAAIAFAHHDPSQLPAGTPLTRHAWLIGGCHTAVVAAGYEYKKPHTEGPTIAACAAVLGVPATAFEECAKQAIEWWTGRDGETGS